MIKIKNKYIINHDGNSYTLQEVKVNQKSNEEYLTNATYHPTLILALESLVRRLQAEYIQTHDITLQEAVNEFKRINEEIKQLALGIDTSEVLK